MNGGAYGREVSDILVSARIALRSGELVEWPLDKLGYTYRHSERARRAPSSSTRPSAAAPATRRRSAPRWTRIARAREESQPLRSRTGGSTFKNPPGHKAWALIDAAGCRGLTRGGAQVSEKHCNFLLNLGSATSADIEALGEDVRRRVARQIRHQLEWEIQRVGSKRDRQARSPRRRPDGRLVERARGFADQRQGRRRGAARARLVERHRARHGPRRRRRGSPN